MARAHQLFCSHFTHSDIFEPEMETGQVDQHQLLAGLPVESSLGNQRMTSCLHKIQKDPFFNYKPKTEIHLV